MTERTDRALHTASCSCGRLHLTAQGDPVRISMCHCLACQQRTGSVFSVQARWLAEAVTIEGEATDFTRISDEGEERTFSFCPVCGSTVYYRTPHFPEHVAVPVGALADPTFPAPRVSVWGDRKHAWVTLPDSLEQIID